MGRMILVSNTLGLSFLWTMQAQEGTKGKDMVNASSAGSNYTRVMAGRF